MIASYRTRPGNGRRSLGFLIVCLLLAASPGVFGATLLVDTLEDRAIGEAGEGCTLRAAVESVNSGGDVDDCANSGGTYGTNDTIGFATSLFELDDNDNPVALTVELTVREQLEILVPLTINGRITDGDDDIDVTVDALGNLSSDGDSDNFTCDNGTPIRVFRVQADTTVNNLNLTGGCATGATPEGPQGGAIRLSGATLTLDDVNITNSLALEDPDDVVEGDESGEGGAIFIADGTLVLMNSSIQSNTAGLRGGGIANTSSATLAAEDCVLATACTISLDNVRIANNIAGDSLPERTIFGYGGGLHNEGGVIVGRVVTFDQGTTTRGNSASVSGGGIWNASTGTIQLVSATLQNNRARALDQTDPNAVLGGGAIFNDGGDLTIEFATFRSNGVVRDDVLDTEAVTVHGGAIASTGGTLDFDTIALTGNAAGQREVQNGDEEVVQELIPGLGGALYVEAGNLTIVDSTLFSNAAQSDGGAIWHASDNLDMERVTVQSNEAHGGDEEATMATGGGGLYNDGPATILDSRFYANVADGENGAGGAILHAGGTLDITGTEIGRNNATFGAGIDNSGILTLTEVFLGAPQVESNNIASGLGGGLHNRGDGGDATIDDSTIAFNDAEEGGGIWNAGELQINNSTLSNNRALGGDERDGDGGALFQSDAGSALLQFVTVFDNESEGTGAGIAAADGMTVTLESSIVAEAATDSFAAADSLVNEPDPGLDDLQLYGGPTPTHPLQLDSLALDIGDTTACESEPIANLDQRGATRPFDGDDQNGADCDAGSFERTDGPVLEVASNRSDPPDEDTVTAQLGEDLVVLAFSVTNNGDEAVTIDEFNVKPLFNGGVEALRQLTLNDPEEADLEFDIYPDNGMGNNAGNGELDDDEGGMTLGSGDGRTFTCDSGCLIEDDGEPVHFLFVLAVPESEEEEEMAGQIFSPTPIFAGGLLVGLLGLVRLRGLRRRAQWLLVVALLTGGLAACSDSSSIDDIQPPQPPEADPSLQGQLRFKLVELTSSAPDEILIGDGLPVYGPAIGVP